jgi:hypothetical protein
MFCCLRSILFLQTLALTYGTSDAASHNTIVSERRSVASRPASIAVENVKRQPKHSAAVSVTEHLHTSAESTITISH